MIKSTKITSPRNVCTISENYSKIHCKFDFCLRLRMCKKFENITSEVTGNDNITDAKYNETNSYNNNKLEVKNKPYG